MADNHGVNIQDATTHTKRQHTQKQEMEGKAEAHPRVGRGAGGPRVRAGVGGPLSAAWAALLEGCSRDPQGASGFARAVRG